MLDYVIFVDKPKKNFKVFGGSRFISQFNLANIYDLHQAIHEDQLSLIDDFNLMPLSNQY